MQLSKRTKILAGAFVFALIAGQLPISAATRNSTSLDDSLDGTNVAGRTGLIYTDTARTVAPGHGSVTGHVIYGTDNDFNELGIPLGVRYGLAQGIEFGANLDYLTIDPDRGDNSNGFNNLGASGRFKLPIEGPNMPDIAVEMDLSHGPLSNDLGPDGTDLDVKGMATYVFTPQRLLVNGGVGVLRVGKRDEIDSDTVFQINGGVGYPFTPTLTGLAELAVNQFGDNNGAFSIGLRNKGPSGFTFQGLLGFGVGSSSTDLRLGVGLSCPF